MVNINISQLEIPKSSIYATQALTILGESNADLQQLAQVIMQDPLLASSILRYANSPLNRRTNEVTNIPTALNLLGLKSVKSAIVSAMLHTLVSDNTSIDRQILNHMTGVSVACRAIAHRICPQHEYDLEFLGLIHDVGMLVLASNFESQYLQLVTSSRQNQQPIDTLEQAEFGLTHNLVSAHLAQEYRLPKTHMTLLEHFHSEKIVQINNDIDRDECILSLAHFLINETSPKDTLIIESICHSFEELQTLLKLSVDTIAQIRIDINNTHSVNLE